MMVLNNMMIKIFLSLTDSPGTLLPLLALELVHLADHLNVLAADLDHGPLIVVDLRHGATLGLFKSVTHNLLKVGLLEVTGLVCEIHKVFRWSRLKFVLVASCFLLLTILFGALFLKILFILFILVIDILLCIPGV